MKIVLLSDNFSLENRGGVGAVIYNLAKGMTNNGHDISIVTTTHNRSEERECSLENLKIFRIYSDYHERWRSWISLVNPWSCLKVQRILKAINPDIVHAHNIHQNLSYHSLKLAKKYSKAVFLTIHDVMSIHYGKLIPRDENYLKRISVLKQVKEARKRYNPLRNMVIKYYLKYTDKIFTVSDDLKQLLKSNGVKNTETIYNGIDINDWAVNDTKITEMKEKYDLQDKEVIFFGGRISSAKGVGQLLKSLINVKKEINDVMLLIAGERNSYVKKLEIISRNTGLDRNIIFTGNLVKEKLKDAYYCSDVIVVPSLCFDSFPTINLEAMACKKPVIATIFGGSKEIVVDGKTGYLVNPNNAELVAEKILDLLKNPQKAKQFGETGHQRVKQYFSLNEQVNKTLKWYKKYI